MRRNLILSASIAALLSVTPQRADTYTGGGSGITAVGLVMLRAWAIILPWSVANLSGIRSVKVRTFRGDFLPVPIRMRQRLEQFLLPARHGHVRLNSN